MHLTSSGPLRVLLLLCTALLIPLFWPGLIDNLLNRNFKIDYHHDWSASLVALHVGSDLLIGLAYTVIAFILALIVYQNRTHLPFDWVVLAFGLFIIVCGFTHVMHVLVRITPVYWLDAYIRAITAVVSIVTACALPLIPRVGLALRATADLRRKELELQQSLATNQALLEIVQLTERQDDPLEMAQQVLVKFRDALAVDWLGLGVQEGTWPA
ncbi:hypothetical protein ACFSC4_28900 [Deinococcus malanensis]|uniref:hypothetical protein n=1 Tax=Deinococcus malanensis TaxID=1706855 RepID=UPI0036261C96